ncbi:MFS transporter [Paracoccus aurantiacus]|uniref:MFS transporter n=1 Tax=Paracoccus aurantiacus TaxID=2599412 RepID=A0A5C6S9Y0_9RHOB|nr:MFS transporter [Paracoccus aurantiacus]TXB71218.1 MFS transporter [Paracoccus aurantiacus]
MSSDHSPARIAASVLLLWLSGLGAAGQFAKIGVPFSEIIERFPDAGASLGLLLSLVSLIGAVFGMIAGGLVARIGLRRAMLAALLLGAVISLLQSMMGTLAPLLASRVIEGVSHLLIVVAAPTLIAQMTPQPLRNFVMTLWSTFFGVAYALTAWLGMPLVEANGLPALFRFHGFYMLACSLLLAVVLPRPHLGDNPPPALSLQDFLRAQLRAYGSARIAAPGIGWLFYTLTFVSLLSILPALLPVSQRETMMTVLPLVGIATCLLAVPFLLRSLPAIRVTQFGFAAAALMAAMMFFAGPILPAIGLYASLGLIQGSSFAAVPALNESLEDRAMANGLMAQMGNLGNLLGTPLLLVMLGRAGIGGLVASVAGFYVIAILAHSWLELRRRREIAI